MDLLRSKYCRDARFLETGLAERGTAFSGNPAVEPLLNRGNAVGEADTPKYLTILIVDDNESLRKKICERLKGHNSFEVICEAANGLEGVRLTEELQPDIVVLDISMPVFGGIEAAARIRRVATKARIVFLSQHKLPAIAEAALASGGHAYVVKSAASADLIPAIQAVMRGKRFVSKLE
jgi:DNA-binding NarL/FixJ family response regulator